MGLLDTLLSGDNSQIITQLAKAGGIGESDIQNVVGQLLPALSQGVKANMGSPDGLGNLMSALSNGDHQKYLESPEALAESSATDEGNAILGHVLGGKDESRNIADTVAESTGVDSSIIRKLLPLVATTVMGALSKETTNNPLAGGMAGLDLNSLTGGDSSPITSMLTSFLDQDNDGDITDDLLGMAKKFF